LLLSVRQSVRLYVRLSVRPSVAYIANNSRTQRPCVPKFRRKVPHLRCDSHTSFTVKRSNVKVTSPLMLAHIVRHIFRTARPTNFKLSIRKYTDGERRPTSAIGIVTFKVPRSRS